MKEVLKYEIKGPNGQVSTFWMHKEEYDIMNKVYDKFNEDIEEMLDKLCYPGTYKDLKEYNDSLPNDKKMKLSFPINGVMYNFL